VCVYLCVCVRERVCVCMYISELVDVFCHGATAVSTKEVGVCVRARASVCVCVCVCVCACLYMCVCVCV